MTDLRVCTALAAVASFALAAGALADGGDEYGDAVEIEPTEIPGVFTGDTTDNTDAWEEFCPFTGVGAPDEWWLYKPDVDQVLTIDVCLADYDDKVYVLDIDAGFVQIACSDDSPGCEDPTHAKLFAVVLTAGNEYCFVVDGFDAEAFGTYSMAISEYEGCEQECPPEGIAEGEPICDDFYVDEFNGGCNSDPPIFSSIECEDTICGQSGIFETEDDEGNPILSRDTDWYETTTTTGNNLTWTAIAEFPPQLLVIFGGDGSCEDGSYTIVASGQGEPCATLEVVAEEVPPGLYWFWAGPAVFDEFWACGLDYIATLTCEEVEVCDVECPEGSTPEGEPICETDYEDTYNGGCNSTPPVFKPVTCEETICGTSGTYTVFDSEGTQYTYRDTDWFKYTTAYGGDYDWQGQGEFPLLLFIIDAGDESCAEGSYTILDSAVATGACVSVKVSADAQPAGVYWFVAMPGDWEWYPCGVEYYATMFCDEDIPCELECDPGSTAEGEEQCFTGYVDETNGGCFSSPPVFGSISAGETVCGYTGTYKVGSAPTRDTDWYAYDAPVGPLSFSVIAEAKVIAYIVDPGDGSCDPGSYTILAEATGEPCEVAEATYDVTEAGEYWLVIFPFDSDEVPCDSLYNATVAGGVECPEDLSGDGVVDVVDLLELLASWGACQGCPADLNGDGVVDVVDLLQLLGAWGPC